MAQTDDIRLMAYLDGELAPRDREAIDEALRGDPALRERMRLLRQGDERLAGALDEVMEGAMPPLRAFSKPIQEPGFWTLLSHWFGAERGLRWQPMAVCALLLVFLGGSGGYWLSLERQLRHYQQAALLSPVDQQLLEKVLNQTLETRSSGDSVRWHNEQTGQGGVITPVRTFKSEQGRYCREFRDERSMLAGSREERGVACRHDGGEWQVQVRYLL